jgi:hypothetical protein
MLSVGTIVGGGFRLLRERPLAVATWGLLYFLATALVGLVMQPVAAIQAASMNGDPAATMNAMQAVLGRMMLVYVAFLVLFVMLTTASQRAVLRPEQGGFAYLRFGMDELRVLGLAIILLVMIYAGILVLGIVLGLAMAAVMALAGMGAFPGVMLVYICIMLAVVIWFEVRFSLAFPLTLLRRKIIIGEAWRVSSGRFWTLFGAYFVLALILAILWIAIAMVTMGPYLAELIRSGLNPEALQAAMRHQMARQFGSFDATTILGWALSALAGALGLALFGGAIATAARELTVDRAGMEQTFG